MSKQIEALKLALEALDCPGKAKTADEQAAITAIREALAEQPAPPPECQTEAEKTAFAFGWWKALESVRQPSEPWVGLTDEEVDECYYWKDRLWTTDELVRHVEAKLKERNT